MCRILFNITFTLILSIQGFASNKGSQLIPDGSVSRIRSEYLSFLKKYNRKMCTRSDRRTFEHLLSKYRAVDFYVPYTSSGQVDLSAIGKHLPLLEEKKRWLNAQIKSFPKNRQFKRSQSLIKDVRNRINTILEHKKNQLLKNDYSKRNFNQLAELVSSLNSSYTKLTNSASYLLNFAYPVDHLKNRIQFEKVKQVSKLKSNALYFKRKILEDGAYDPNHSRPDIYLRTTLDTIGLYFSTNPSNLSESIRYDLTWSLRQITAQINRGRRKQISRLQEWQTRTNNSINFYKKLLHKNSKKKLIQMAKSKSAALNDLKSFVYLKQAKAFEYLAAQNSTIKPLFVIDQILLNEVGLATPINYRERRDVAQVVINRFNQIEKYYIHQNNNIFQNLKNKTNFKSAIAYKFKWLNVLFKEGEFSFTYFYMPASVYTFCPDFYKTAKVTRNKNIALAVDILRKPESSFTATRYYSRESMIGRISAEKMWPNYKKIPERPGKRIKNIKNLKRLLKKGQFKYYYSFKDIQQKLFNVIEINGDKYSIYGYPKDIQVYNYRNPHKFTFFN